MGGPDREFDGPRAPKFGGESILEQDWRIREAAKNTAAWMLVVRS